MPHDDGHGRKRQRSAQDQTRVQKNAGRDRSESLGSERRSERSQRFTLDRAWRGSGF
jgi:hypothetical protein